MILGPPATASDSQQGAMAFAAKRPQFLEKATCTASCIGGRYRVLHEHQLLGQERHLQQPDRFRHLRQHGKILLHPIVLHSL